MPGTSPRAKALGAADPRYSIVYHRHLGVRSPHLAVWPSAAALLEQALDPKNSEQLFMAGARWLPLLRRLQDWLYGFFLPRNAGYDREATNTLRIFLASHLLGPLFGSTVPLALYIADPTPGYDIAILAFSIGSFWIFPFLLRMGFALKRLTLLSLAIDHFAILWSCFHYGGVASPTLIWMLIIPILSVFYIGGDRRLQLQAAAISAAAAALFFLAYFSLKPPPPDIPPTALLVLGAISTTAVLCYVAFMAIYYARIFDASAEIEEEVKRRHAMMGELRATVAAVNRASAAKSEFLARMSHELRNPLNSIVGYSHLLREEFEEACDEQALKDITRIVHAGQHLIRLITMILDLSKIEAGRMTYVMQKHSLRAIILDAMDRHQREIASGNNRVVLRLCSGLGFARLDEVRVHEILDSVLTNAAQHTRGGTITVEASRDSSEATFSISVTDTGCGMPPEVLASVFDTFSAPREAAGGQYGGTGLNLVVSSRLCAQMGGKIVAASQVGEGSTFTVTLPINPEGGDVMGPADRGAMSAALTAPA